MIRFMQRKGSFLFPIGNVLKSILRIADRNEKKCQNAGGGLGKSIRNISCVVLCLFLSFLCARTSMNIFCLTADGYYLQKYCFELLNDTFNTTSNQNDLEIRTGHIAGHLLGIQIRTKMWSNSFLEKTLEKIDEIPDEIKKKYTFRIESVCDGIEDKEHIINPHIDESEKIYVFFVMLYALIIVTILFFTPKKGFLIVFILIGLCCGYYSCRIPMFIRNEQFKCLNLYMKYSLEKHIKSEVSADDSSKLLEVTFKKKYINHVHYTIFLDVSVKNEKELISNMEHIIRKCIEMNFYKNAKFIFSFYANNKQLHKFVLSSD